MEKLSFYTINPKYVTYLQKAELDYRGMSRILDLSEQGRQKIVCGSVLQINEVEYYVPVSSFKQKMPDNFLILAKNGQVTGSLRFNYMFPVPKALVTRKEFQDEPDPAYRALLSQELLYCNANQEIIRHLAMRTYKRVLLGKNRGLVKNSCAFLFLEQKCKEYAAELANGSADAPAAAGAPADQ